MKMLNNVQLREHTTFKLGGPAAFFVSVESAQELDEAVRWAEDNTTPFIILGGGSNIIFPDSGWSGLVIKINIEGTQYSEEEGGVFVTAGAGVVWDVLVDDTVQKKLWGLENLSAIPGTVGATPVQNVGAYGVEVSDHVVYINAYNTKTKKVERLTNKDCLFSYRNSFFKTLKGKDFIITAVCFQLNKKQVPNLSYRDLETYFKDYPSLPSLLEIRKAIIEIRKKKFPDLNTMGTAGSFFKNPVVSSEKGVQLQHKYPSLPCFTLQDGDVKISLAWIFDNVLKIKGERLNSVGTFENQPLVFVNYNDATTEEVLSFAKTIQGRVLSEVGIEIIPEVTIVENLNK